MKKLTIKDAELRGKRILMRVDFNVPLDENLHITDDKRILAALPTIEYAVKEGGKVILMSHLVICSYVLDLSYLTVTVISTNGPRGPNVTRKPSLLFQVHKPDT